MNSEEYKSLISVRPIPKILRGSDLENQMDRTLIWGYTMEREDFHVFLKDGEIQIEVGDLTSQHREALQRWDENDVRSNSEYVPGKRVYPEACDFEFCKLLKEGGVAIPFTTWTDREPKQFYAPIR